MRPLYILTHLYPRHTIHHLRLPYNLPNSTTSTSTTRLIVNIKDIVGTGAEDIEDYNTEDIVEITIKTRPEKNTISVTKKNIGLQNIIPKTIRLFINNTTDNLCIQLRKRLY
jgi:hypothetical protein